MDEFKQNTLCELETVSKILNCIVQCCEGLQNEIGLMTALRLKNLVVKEIQRLRKSKNGMEVVA